MAPSRQYSLKPSTAATLVARATSSTRYDTMSSVLVGLLVGGILLTIFFISLCIRIRKVRREHANNQKDQNGFGNERGCRIDSPDDVATMTISARNSRPAWPQQAANWAPTISISRPASPNGSYGRSNPSPPPSYAQVSDPVRGPYSSTPLPAPPPPLLLAPGHHLIPARPLSSASEGSTRRSSLESHVSCRITDLAELPDVFIEPATPEAPAPRPQAPRLTLTIPRTQKWVSRH